MEAYIGVTVHFITADWKLRTEVLSFDELDGSHSGENQAEHLHSIVKDFEIQNKVCCSFDSSNHCAKSQT